MNSSGIVEQHGQQHHAQLRPLLVLGAHPQPEALDQPAVDGAEDAPPPPPPTLLIVDRPPDMPVAVTVDHVSMSVSWSPVSVTVQSTEIRVVEYLLTYRLEMQKLEGDSSCTDVPALGDEGWSAQYVGPATYVQVKGLRPGRRYAVRVQCQPVVTNDETVVVQLAPPSEVLLLATPPTAPQVPAPPLVASRARNTIKFKWQEPEETGGRPILQYVLDMVPPPLGWEGPPNAEGWYSVYAGPECSFLVKRLQPGVRYAARVKAISMVGESPYSTPVPTSTQATVPSPPGAPVVVAACESSVTLQWEPALDNGAAVSGYQLDVDDGRGSGFMPLHHGPATTFTAGGLKSGVRYKFRVRAENSEGRGQWSAVCEAVTAATTPSSLAPPAMLGSNQSTISINWKDVEFDGGSAVVGYEVEMQPKCKAAKRGMPGDWVLVFQGPSKACTLGGLRAGCTYRVRVRAFNTRGPGPFSMPADVSTAEDVPEAPASLAPTARSQTSLVMMWAEPEHDGGSAVSTYRLEMRLLERMEDHPAGKEVASQASFKDLCAAGTGASKGKLQDHFDAVYVGPETSAEVHGLEPGCRYQFQVLAINKQGASRWSQPATVDTRPGLPLPPDPPQVLAHTSFTMQLAWQAPYGQGAPVTAFILQLCQLRALQQAQQAARASSLQHLQLEQQQWQHSGEADQQHVDAAAGAAADRLPLPPGAPLPGPAAHSAAPAAAAPPPQQQQLAAEPAGPAGAPEASPAGLLHGSGAGNEEGGPNAASAAQFPASDILDGATSAQPDVADVVFQTVYHGSDLGCTVRGLDPDTEYAYRLKACNNVGASPWSAMEVFRTGPAPPSAPQELMLSGATSCSAELSWTPPEQDHGAALAGYQLEFASAGRASRGQQVHWRAGYHGTQQHCQVGQLAPGREYLVRVRAGNACGWGPWSELLQFSTKPDVPEAPEAPTFSNRMGTSVRVKWQPPAEDNGAMVTQYLLEMVPAAGSDAGGAFKQVYEGDSTSCRVQPLAPGTEYLFRVRAANLVGSGPFSPVASVATTRAPPSPPTCVEAAPVGDAAAPGVLVSWEAPVQGELQAACISYEVDATPAGAPAAGARPGEAAHHKAAAAPVRQTCSAKVSQHLVTGLQPGAAYAVRVRGIGADGAGHGEWSEGVSVHLPAVEKPAAAVGSAGSGDEEGEVPHARRRKQRSSSTGDLHHKTHRAQSLGVKTVAAKAKPKKTWLTSFAGMIGLQERELWRYLGWAKWLFLAVLGLWAIYSWLWVEIVRRR